MMTIFGSVAGTLLLVAAVAAFWHLMPSNGKLHPWVTKPYLESAIPLGIMTGLVFGTAVLVITIF